MVGTALLGSALRRHGRDIGKVFGGVLMVAFYVLLMMNNLAGIGGGHTWPLPAYVALFTMGMVLCLSVDQGNAPFVGRNLARNQWMLTGMSFFIAVMVMTAMYSATTGGWLHAFIGLSASGLRFAGPSGASSNFTLSGVDLFCLFVLPALGMKAMAIRATRNGRLNHTHGRF